MPNAAALTTNDTIRMNELACTTQLRNTWNVGFCNVDTNNMENGSTWNLQKETRK
jgi:hypothetical protein